MTLHPVVLADLLAAEAAVARGRLAGRVLGITAEGRFVYCRFIDGGGQPRRLRLDGGDYDRMPLGLSVVDDAGKPLPGDRWPAGVVYGAGATHPVLKRPWACLRGTYEYHTYPGHTGGGDAWELSRADLRVADVLSHVLLRCGR